MGERKSGQVNQTQGAGGGGGGGGLNRVYLEAALCVLVGKYHSRSLLYTQEAASK